jgi:hypothetical protein
MPDEPGVVEIPIYERPVDGSGAFTEKTDLYMPDKEDYVKVGDLNYDFQLIDKHLSWKEDEGSATDSYSDYVGIRPFKNRKVFISQVDRNVSSSLENTQRLFFTTNNSTMYGDQQAAITIATADTSTYSIRLFRSDAEQGVVSLNSDGFSLNYSDHELIAEGSEERKETDCRILMDRQGVLRLQSRNKYIELSPNFDYNNVVHNEQFESEIVFNFNSLNTSSTNDSRNFLRFTHPIPNEQLVRLKTYGNDYGYSGDRDHADDYHFGLGKESIILPLTGYNDTTSQFTAWNADESAFPIGSVICCMADNPDHRGIWLRVSGESSMTSALKRIIIIPQ